MGGPEDHLLTHRQFLAGFAAGAEAYYLTSILPPSEALLHKQVNFAAVISNAYLHIPVEG